MNLLELKELSNKLNNNYISIKTKLDVYNDDVKKLNSKKVSIEKDIDNNNKAMSILTEAGKISRENARKHFENIVTNALQFVTNSNDYEFVIQEIQDRAKASYEFYVKSTVNGIECLQKPEEANGGGFVDIIALSAKYAYLEIFNDPKIMSGTLILDEPGKMISEQMSIKFAEYISFLGKQYNRQTIMITHSDTLSAIADKTYVVSKKNNGVSEVKDINQINNFTINQIEKNIAEILEETK